MRAPSGPRKRGWPRQSWGNTVMNNCLRVAGPLAWLRTSARRAVQRERRRRQCNRVEFDAFSTSASA
eukprot:3726358-Pyramimonas_sp.AAC.1